jgi:hypothetical protein
MKIPGKIRPLTGLAVISVLVLTAACGGSGGGSGGPGGGVLPGGQQTLVPTLGDGQEVLIGQAADDQLAVRLADDGVPVAGATVTFSAPREQGILLITEAVTDSDGLAQTAFVAGLLPGPVSVTAEAQGLFADFNLIVRHPRLGEVLAGSVAGDSVVMMPVLAGLMDGGSEFFLVLLKGEAQGADLAQLPMAGELTGASIDGALAEDLSVLICDAAELIGPAPGQFPLVSDLLPSTGPDGSIADLPVVVDLTINGEPAAMGIPGYDPATGLIAEPVFRLGDLVDAGAVVDGDSGSVYVVDLPLMYLEPADYPADGDTSTASYMAMPWTASYVPVFDAAVEIQGGWVSASLPKLDASPGSTVDELAPVDGAYAQWIAVMHPAQVETNGFLPRVSLVNMPVEYLAVMDVIGEQIMPDIQDMGSVFESMAAPIESIVATITENQDVIDSLINGEFNVSDPSDIMQYLGLAGMMMDLLADVDDITEMGRDLIAIGGDMINDIRADLLPAVSDALPEDGIPFGGVTDGSPSTVRDDVIPFIDALLAVAQDALAVFDTLLADLESMIPDNLNLFTMIPMIMDMMNGGLDQLMADIDALAPVLQDGLQITLDQGIPIAEDLIDEFELALLGDDTVLGDIEEVSSFFGSLEQEIPAGTMIGDLDFSGFIVPVLEDVLPPEMGPVEDLDLLNDVIPYLEEQQLEDLVIPPLRSGLDEAELGIPELITSLDDGIISLLSGLFQDIPLP